MIQQNNKIKVGLIQSKHIYALLLAIIAFVCLTVFVIIYPINFVDIQFSLLIQQHHNSFLDVFMTAVSSPGHTKISVPMVLAVALVFLICKKKKEALFVVFTMLAGLVSTLVKYFVNRPRPSKALVRVIEITKQQSFPSGHTLFYTVFFGFIVYLMFKLTNLNFYRRLIVASIAGAMIVLVFFSRIYLGAHWLSDVIGGYLLGAVYLLILIYFYELKRFKG